MPDHVRHPNKYTAYVLEQPILVGSGNDGSNPAKPSDTLRVSYNPDPALLLLLTWQFDFPLLP